MKNSPELLKLRSSFNELEDLYLNQKLSPGQIARKFNVSRAAVSNVLNKFKIKRRTNGESYSAANDRKIIEFSYLQEQLLLGTLLGDACLHRSIKRCKKSSGKTYETYRIRIFHSKKFLEYVIHKRDILGKGVKSKKLLTLHEATSGHGSKMVGFYFCHTPTLKKLAKICHDSNYKKAITKEWIDKLDWPAIAYWYQDDGSLSIYQKRKLRVIRFHTQSFKFEEVKMLQSILQTKFNLTTTLYKTRQNQYIICSRSTKQQELSLFLKNIEPYLVPCMKYKIRQSGLFRPFTKIRNKNHIKGH